MNRTRPYLAVLTVTALAWSLAGHGQAPERADEPRRTRVALGPQLVPSYPGADGLSLRPLIDVARAPAGQPFAFEAADESFGFPLLTSRGFSFGPSLGIEGKREASDVGTQVPEVGFSFEIGGFAQQQIGDNFRLRAEARQGVSGHEGFIGILSADYVLRDGLRREVSFGPRLTVTDGRYQDAYFSIRPEDAGAAGLPAFDSGGGVQAVGAAAAFIQQFSPRWGIYSYAKYDRLVGDAANSPLVTGYGARDQFSGGVALTYTFGTVTP